MPPRGGPRKAKPQVDVELLTNTLGTYVKEVGLSAAFDLGPYTAGHDKTQAASVKGLAKSRVLLSKLAVVNSTLLYKYRDLKDSLASVATTWKELVGQQAHGHKAWKEWMADNILTVLLHARRLKDPVRYNEVLHKATVFEKQALKKVRELVLNAQEDQDEKKDLEDNEDQDDLDKKDEQAEDEPGTLKDLDLGKLLDKAGSLSDMDLDIPMTPKTCRSAVGSLTQAAEELSPVPAKKAVLKSAIQKKPALKKPAAANLDSTFKRPAAAADPAPVTPVTDKHSSDMDEHGLFFLSCFHVRYM